ncbi:MAG: tol-pal system protein YbgF [Devosia sp.]
MHLSLPKGAARGLAAFSIALTLGLVTPGITIAQSKSEAQLAVQIQDLESQVRTLTGQVEGLQFQLTQMQELITKMQEDYEFRFQELEGGGGKKTDAATPSGGETPAGTLPQPATGDTTTTTLPAADAPVTTDAPMDDVGDSADPLLGKGEAGDTTIGTLGGANGQPLNLSLDGGQALSDGDANAQYAAGYDAIVRGDYPFAEEQFRQFVALYPKDPQAADATNWLGEALLQRQAYDEAADVLLTGFQTYEKSQRAPDLLLKLGIALAGAGETDTACRTYLEVGKRYPTQPAAFLQRLAEERAKAKCPA